MTATTTEVLALPMRHQIFCGSSILAGRDDQIGFGAVRRGIDQFFTQASC